MSLPFNDLARQFDQTRGLPTTAISAWIACVDDLAGHRSVTIGEPGIGTGRLALPLALAGQRVRGVDIAPGMLDACLDHASRLGVGHLLDVSVGDATALPWPAASIDISVIAQLLYLVPEWPRVLDELHRVTTPKGVALHVRERSVLGPDLARWDAEWRQRIEATGYRHLPPKPLIDEEMHAFDSRWRSVRVEPLDASTFGQTVGDARDRYGERLRGLYASVPDDAWNDAVSAFLRWSTDAFPEAETPLNGNVQFEVVVASDPR